jgi:hypothetical protein
MNVTPKHYTWPEFYRQVVDVTDYSFSRKAILRRIGATKAFVPRWMNVVRAMSSEGYGRIRYYSKIYEQLIADPAFRSFFEQDTDVLPPFYEDRIRRDLGFMWPWLPQGALHHDPRAYLKSYEAQKASGVAAGAAA